MNPVRNSVRSSSYLSVWVWRGIFHYKPSIWGSPFMELHEAPWVFWGMRPASQVWWDFGGRNPPLNPPNNHPQRSNPKSILHRMSKPFQLGIPPETVSTAWATPSSVSAKPSRGRSPSLHCHPRPKIDARHAFDPRLRRRSGPGTAATAEPRTATEAASVTKNL